MILGAGCDMASVSTASVCIYSHSYETVCSVTVHGLLLQQAPIQLMEEMEAVAEYMEVDTDTIFSELDHLQKGRLSMRCFIGSALELGLAISSRRIMDAWPFLPQDGKGRVSRSSFVSYFSSIDAMRRARRGFAAYLVEHNLNSYQCFVQMDVNRLGSVAMDDLQTALRLMRPSVSDSVAAAALPLIPLSAKGGRVEFAPFSRVFGGCQRSITLIKRAMRTIKMSLVEAFAPASQHEITCRQSNQTGHRKSI